MLQPSTIRASAGSGLGNLLAAGRMIPTNGAAAVGSETTYWLAAWGWNEIRAAQPAHRQRSSQR